MAAIDKFYIKSYDQYKELRDFFISAGTVTDEYGNTFRPLAYLFKLTEEDFNEIIKKKCIVVMEYYRKGEYEYEVENGYMTQEEYNNFDPMKHVDVAIMNTPIFFDVWMIRNCQHIDWLQEELKSKYKGGWSKVAFTDYNEVDLYEQILNRTSCYDTFQRNGLGKKIRVDMNQLKKFKPWGLDRIHISMTIEFPDDMYPDYHVADDYWTHSQELRRNKDYITNRAHFDYTSRKAIFRKIQKWNLPENSVVHVEYWFNIGKNRYMDKYVLTVKKSKRWNKRKH